MLTITPQAAAAITDLLASSEDRGRVLRIVERPAGAGRRALMLALSGSRPTDLVVAERGIRVFLEPEVAERLDGKRLHARLDRGRMRFVVGPLPR